MQTPKPVSAIERLPRTVARVAALLVALLLTPAAHAFVCGNGIVEPGETCDDGNTVSGDGCSSTCQFEGCPITGTWVDQYYPTTKFSFREDGSGNITGAMYATIDQLPVIGTRTVGDIQFSSFPVNGTGYATETVQDCVNHHLYIHAFPDFDLTRTSTSFCGDGVLDPGEVCDDGNFVNGDGCSVGCTVEACRNGILDEGEECDDGNSVDGDACENDCTLPRCGNGIIDATEQCDDGNLVDGDGCDHSCGIPGCPNGVIDPGEQCDDGNVIDNDGCARNCKLPGCGNGIRETGEQCDDGNLMNGDWCSSTCTVTPLATTTSTTSPSTTVTTTSTTTTSVPVCADSDGDGEVDSTDECPGTPPAEPVDQAGCSIAQFCARFDATTAAGARACRRADWRNDEPLMRPSEADCAVDRGGFSASDNRCVPHP